MVVVGGGSGGGGGGGNGVGCIGSSFAWAVCGGSLGIFFLYIKGHVRI